MRRLLTALLVVIAILALAPVAEACSCVSGDPRSTLEVADGAFIGELIARPESRAKGSFRSSGEVVDWRFRVHEAVKGDLGDEVVIRSAISGVSCGLSVKVGESVGLFLDRKDGAWRAGLCSDVKPEELRAAAKPLPAPDGSGRPRFIVGTDHGEVRTIALDASGDVVRYGYGDGLTLDLDLCPGSRVVVELVRGVTGDRSLVARRDVATMNVIDEAKVTRDVHLHDISCRSADGGTVVLTGRSHDSVNVVVLRLVGQEIAALFEGVARAVSPMHPGQDVFVATGSRGASLERIDVRSGQRRKVIPIVGKTHEIEVNAAATHLVGKAGRRTMYVADLETGEITRGPSHAPTRWVDNETFLSAGHTVRIYNLSLEVIDTWDDAPPRDGVAVDGVFYGFDGRVLQSIRGGSVANVIGELETDTTYGLVVIPEDAQLTASGSWSRTAPLSVAAVAIAVLLLAVFLKRRTAAAR